MGFSPEELERHRGRTVPDLVGDTARLVVVGINPSLWTAATGTHFAHPANRFWPALHLAGVLGRRVAFADGLDDGDLAHVLDRGLAITNLVARATARASELSADELRAGRAALERRIADWSPAVVAVAGVTAYRTAFARRGAATGEQPEGFAGARLWVVPNPSGLNAHETTASLARAYRVPAEAAGMPLDPPRW